MAKQTTSPARRPTVSPAKGTLTPLWVISLFVSLTETVLGVGVIKTAGGVQIALTLFVLVFPLLVAGSFFLILWFKPWVFYAPGEYGGVSVVEYIRALQGGIPLVTKTADVGDEVVLFGKPDRFQLLFKAQGATWKKSTKAMEVPGGCVVQVTTENIRPDGTWDAAEAITYVPGAAIKPEEGGDNGRYLGMSKTIQE